MDSCLQWYHFNNVLILSMLQGYYVYKDTWDAFIREGSTLLRSMLLLSKESENVYNLCVDPLSIQKLKDKIVVAFLQCTCACSFQKLSQELIFSRLFCLTKKEKSKNQLLLKITNYTCIFIMTVGNQYNTAQIKNSDQQEQDILRYGLNKRKQL